MNINRQHIDRKNAGPPEVFVTTSNTTLKPHQDTVIVDLTGNVTVTLPPVQEWAGQLISTCIRSRTSGALTVQGDGSEANSGGYSINTQDAAGDRALFYSDGKYIWLIASVIA